MMRSIRKISICGLAALLFVSAMSCCCLTKAAAAAKEKPSCHQAAHESEKAHDSANCPCEHNFATYTIPADFQAPQLVMENLTVSEPAVETVIYTVTVDAYQAPPPIQDITPLYIKNSILRI